MDFDDLTTGEKVAGLGGILAIVGAFLTWVNAGIVTVSGIDGDGIFTLIFGGIVLAIVLTREWERADMIVTGVLGLLTALIAGNVYGNLDAQTGDEFIEAAAGGGLHLTLLSGLLLIGAGAYGYRNERQDDTEPAELTAME